MPSPIRSRVSAYAARLAQACVAVSLLASGASAEDNAVERTAKKAAAATERGVNSAVKGVERGAKAADKALTNAAKKTETWVKDKTK